jgi:hypothetical protein
VRTKAFESPAKNVTDTLEVGRVSAIIRKSARRKLHVSVSDVAVGAEDSELAKITNAIDDIVKTVARTKK